MTDRADYDFHRIKLQREQNVPWKEIASEYDRAPSTVRKAFKRWVPDGTVPDTERSRLDTDEPLRTVKVNGRGPKTEEELLAAFGIDTDLYGVENLRLSYWEQRSRDEGFQTLYSGKATLRRNVARDAEIARQALEQAALDMQQHSPEYEGPGDLPRLQNSDPVLFEVAVMDPHLGALAWGEECGEDYDLNIGVRDYGNATGYLLGLTDLYNVDRILFVVGNDTLHVDHVEQGKVPVTTAGTAQDFDSRLAKLFTEARRAIVKALDRARLIAPVDVLIVPGNHDEHSIYKLGEVLNAWYRNDEQVQIVNTPKLFKCYRYGKNLFGFTHGQKLKRRKDPLALWLADEAPADMWAGTTYREIHTGHWHAAAELEQLRPRQNLSETRGTRIRSLPALTASDAWHVSEGYRHHRAATALAYKRSGGLAGFHEFTP